MSNRTLPISGYTIKRILALEQHYDVVPIQEVEQEVDRLSSYHWDWIPSGRREFHVYLWTLIHPSKVLPERIEVGVMATFTIATEQPKVPLDTFVLQDAPTLMFPYMRELISSLTALGVYGIYYMPPFNISEVITAEHTFEESTGVRTLRQDPEVSRTFDFPTEVAVSKTKRRSRTKGAVTTPERL